MIRLSLLSLACVIAGIGPATAGAAPPLPNEFESPSDALDPLFAYFGGITSWGTTPSTHLVHSGNSLEVWAMFVDDIFSTAGFAVGTFGTTPPGLAVPPGADTFSMTIEAPTNGVLSFTVTLREDDNGDGLIDVNNFDDQWESFSFLLEPGVHVYNIPLVTFGDNDPDAGNGVQNFETTSRVAYLITFESRDAYPGGQIVGPVSFHIDHAGLYNGPQELPAPTCAGDITGPAGAADGDVDALDFLMLVGQWGSPCPGPCDADITGPTGAADGSVDALDFLMLIGQWGSPCTG